MEEGQTTKRMNTNRRGVIVREWPRRADHGPRDWTTVCLSTNERATAHKHSNKSPSDHSSPFHDEPTSQTLGLFFLWMSPMSHVPINPFQRNVHLPASKAGNLHSPRQKESPANDQFCVPSPPTSRLSAPANVTLVDTHRQSRRLNVQC